VNFNVQCVILGDVVKLIQHFGPSHGWVCIERYGEDPLDHFGCG
jgi:hypothetical protein